MALASVVALAVGVGAGTRAVARTEAGERDVEAALAGSGLLEVRARVAAGSSVLVEVCASDVQRSPLPVPVIIEAPNERGESTIVAVLTVGAATLDSARRADGNACWTAYEHVVSGGGIVRAHIADDERVEAPPVTGRIHVRDAPGWSSRPALLLALVGALGLAASLAMRGRASSPQLASVARGPVMLALFTGLALGAGAAQAVRYVGDGSALLGLARGLILGAAEIAIAVALASWLARRTELSVGEVLGAVQPRGGALALLLTPIAGTLCAFAGVFALRLVPSTGGAAPIEVFVARPSGMLAFALLAVVVPISEELFFRGFVYGTAHRALGAPAAFALSAGLFVAAHAPQDWGSWGGLVAVALVGLVTTSLRATTRSVAVPMLAHLVYNGLLAASAL